MMMKTVKQINIKAFDKFMTILEIKEHAWNLKFDPQFQVQVKNCLNDSNKPISEDPEFIRISIVCP